MRKTILLNSEKLFTEFNFSILILSSNILVRENLDVQKFMLVNEL